MARKLKKGHSSFLAMNPQCKVAVGIAVTGYPPRGSGRALLTHPALTLGSGVKAVHWVRVDDSSWYRSLYPVAAADVPVPVRSAVLASV